MTISIPSTNLPQVEVMGQQRLFVLPLKIRVADGSFLHIGGTPSPLTEKKQPVFSVDGQPIIPASSFKGAFRYQVELLLIEKKKELAQALGLVGNNIDLLKPSIPAARRSKAEEDLLTRGYRGESELKIGTNGDIQVGNGLCPVSYFFGANGLEGFIRVPNFSPQPGEWRIDQTRIRIDRRSGTAAQGAFVTGEQVKPRSVFTGNLQIFQERHGAIFGYGREIGKSKVDKWLENWSEADNEKRQLFLMNQVLLPALNNLKVLGGQKSLGAGQVDISLQT
jgi:CRISPR/Cas system CMR subunit Cmr4 (Cas7 group RAMP superfamily)